MKIGIANIIITPNLENRKEPLRLAGYSPREYCSGIHDDLFARCVYFEGNDREKSTHIMMIVCDIISILKPMANIVKSKISEEIPIDPDNIMISATHTHHGPDYAGNFGAGGGLNIVKGFLFPQPQTDDLVLLIRRIIKVAKEAYNSRKPSLLGADQTYIPENEQVMFNRRDVLNPKSAEYPVSVIKIVSDEEQDKGRISGIIINYSIHGTMLPRSNTLITADYVGYLIKAIEKKNPNLKGKVLYFNGPCGEINPLGAVLRKRMAEVKNAQELSREEIYDQIGTWDDANYIGEVIANRALSIVDSISCNDYPQLNVQNAPIHIPVKGYNRGKGMKTALNRIMYNIKIHIFSSLARLGLLKDSIFFKLESIHKGYVPTHLQLIDLGACLTCNVPGEYFLELGNEVISHAQSFFPDKKIFVIELANDQVGYIYTIEAYLEGGYESSFSITPLGGRFITMKFKQLIEKYSRKIK